MAEKVERMWCNQCGDFRRCTSRGTNHFLHLFIVVMLIGSSYLIPFPLSNLPEMLALIWVITWVVLSLSRNWRCDECGERMKARDTTKRHRAERVSKAQSKRAGKSSRQSPTGSGAIPQRPSVFKETARAEWDAKYGGK